MTDTRQYIGFGDVENFLVKSYKCITGGREFDIDKYGPYVDAVRHVLVPSLEKQILFCLERFVYNEDFQHSTYQPYLSRYKESVLTAYAKYNELGTSIEAMRDSFTVDQLVDFFGHSFLTNSRLAKIGNDLDSIGIERNWLGYVNVLNYINEKDFWVCSSSSSRTSRQYTSICSPSSDNILSEVNAEDGSHVVERTRGLKRPRKRAATHINRKHYKLERLAQLSDGSFKVTESLYDLLKSSWDLHDSVHTRRRLKRNCGDLRRSSFADHRRKNRTTDWKNENLALFIRKIGGTAGTKTCVENEDRRNTEVRTCLALPCKVEQLLCRLDRVDPSLTMFYCSFIKKKFQTKLYNVCSRLNNLLSKMDGKTINSIYLVSEIRKDYLNFKLKQTPPPKCNSRQLFSARVMTCESLHRYGIRRNGSRQKLKSQSFWAAKKASELSSGNMGWTVFGNTGQFQSMDFDKDEAISSIEISFSECEGGAVDQRNVIRELSCDPQNLEGLIIEDSSPISDVIQKLELSPFRLQETAQSFTMRSKIRDIVRSIMICTQQHSPRSQKGGSISVQAVVSTSSLHAVDHEEEVLPNPSKPSTVSKIVSLIASEICPSRSKKIHSCAESVKSKRTADSEDCARLLSGSTKSGKPVAPRSCIETRERGLSSGGSVRPNKSLHKSRAYPSSRYSAKPKRRNRYEICTSEKPARSKDFTGSRGRSLSNKMAESIASEISNALARTKFTGNGMNDDGDDYEIAVTVEIEDSSESSDEISNSISRHTHLLPSMKSVRLGTSGKYFRRDSEKSKSSSSEDAIFVHDNFTSMNKSMISSSNRGTISAKSYGRIKHLIRERVCKKFSDADSCRPNSSKTIVSSRKYYLSIPSSKASRVRLRREISESSSSSHESLQLPVCNCHLRTSEASLSIDKSLMPSRFSDCYSGDLEADTESSGAATFDKNSIYGCVEDRLVNRYLREIVDDYSDVAADSPRYNDVESQVSSDFGICGDDGEKLMSRYYDADISSKENDSSFTQIFMNEDDASTSVGISCQIHSNEGFSPRLDDYDRFERNQRHRRACGWSTCAIRPSNSVECPAKSNYRVKMRGKGDSPQQNIFCFHPSNIVEKYKKRFRNLDKSFRAKLLQYAGYCKNAKNILQKQICIDDIYEASRTSVPSCDFRRHKYSGVYSGG